MEHRSKLVEHNPMGIKLNGQVVSDGKISIDQAKTPFRHEITLSRRNLIELGIISSALVACNSLPVRTPAVTRLSVPSTPSVLLRQTATPSESQIVDQELLSILSDVSIDRVEEEVQKLPPPYKEFINQYGQILFDEGEAVYPGNIRVPILGKKESRVIMQRQSRSDEISGMSSIRNLTGLENLNPHYPAAEANLTIPIVPSVFQDRIKPGDMQGAYNVTFKPGIPFYSSIRPAITLIFPSLEVAKPKYKEFYRQMTKFVILKEALSITFTNKYLYSVATLMDKYHLSADILANDGNKYEGLTQSLATLLNNNGRINYAIDLASAVASVRAFRDDPALLGQTGTKQKVRTAVEFIVSSNIADSTPDQIFDSCITLLIQNPTVIEGLTEYRGSRNVFP